jgi:hypothetical protein
MKVANGTVLVHFKHTTEQVPLTTDGATQ